MRVKIKVINAFTGEIIGTAYSATEAYEIGEKSLFLYRVDIEIEEIDI